MFNEFLVNLEVRLEQLWPILDLLVVTAGFYGSESSRKVISIRLETVGGPVFGHVGPPGTFYMRTFTGPFQALNWAQRSISFC